MSDVRQRKGKGRSHKSTSPVTQKGAAPASKSKTTSKDVAECEGADDSLYWILSWSSVILGLVAMLCCGLTHAKYMSQIHENWLWFTNIKVLAFNNF